MIREPECEIRHSGYKWMCQTTHLYLIASPNHPNYAAIILPTNLLVPCHLATPASRLEHAALTVRLILPFVYASVDTILLLMPVLLAVLFLLREELQQETILPILVYVFVIILSLYLLIIQ